MARIVAIVSGKGGVGKTTLASNLGAVLSEFGKKTVIVDGNVTTPNISLHLGIPFSPVTLHDVLRGDAHIRDAIYKHPKGFSIVPGSISLNDIRDINLDNLSEALKHLESNTEIILLDAPAGLGKETLKSIEVAHDILIITNPDIPSVTEALKVKELATSLGKNVLGVVVNRIRREKVELSEEEISDILELPIIGKIPEDPFVHHSIMNKTPVVFFNPNSPSSIAFKKLGADLIGEEIEMEGLGLFQRLINWLRR